MCIKYFSWIVFVAAFAVCLGDARLCNVTNIQQRKINNNTVAPPITVPAAAKMASRLSTLRALMSSQPCALAAYVIPTADAHNSEYISPADARREWMTGFTGSAGTAVVTMSKGLVWTDGRYYTQFEKEVDPELWGLMKQSLPDTPSIEKWLTVNLKEGDVVGFNPHFMSREQFTPIETALSKARMHFVAVKEDLVDEARVRLQDPPPRRPTNALITHTLQYSGKKAGDKIADLRQQMKEKKASAIVITALDEVAYILNLRGSDIAYNPVFFSYLIITDAEVVLFWNEGDLTPDVQHHLKYEGVELVSKPYQDVEPYLKSLARKLSEDGSGHHSIWLSSEASEAVHRAASGQGDLTKTLDLISDVSPVALMKLVKNEVELQGFRACHIRDSTALVRFFRWLEESVAAGDAVTEVQAGEKLLEFRKAELEFMGPSFETIAGAGENGAVIHYSAREEGPQRVIRRDDMFLLDSGGQYRDGTTDVTRTRHMGTPTPEQRDAFTRVLKGQMMIGSALFPRGVKGNVLDSFARKSLWDVGLDYAHGTGHGVGHFLNVHEGPSGVSWRPYVHDPGLQPGQILSNEPGYYKVGEYGIRHEDLVEIIDVSKDSQHPRACTLLDDFNGRGVLGFNTLTLVPHHRKCIDSRLLNDFELSYLNSYHKRVLDEIGEVLRTRGLDKDLDWLTKECAPIVRA